jgi:regulator of RNase E activity RraA
MPDVPTFERPPREIIEALTQIGSATTTGELSKLGIRNPQLVGLTTFNPGKVVVGPAITLQFMPKREDQHWGDEYSSAPERELHRTAILQTQPGDVVVVDARGSMSSGIFGEMMLTSFKAIGGLGIFIDGCIRDFPEVKKLDLGLWLKGVTPNYHTQTDIFPHAVNVPIACCGTFIKPGDLIVADDDGAVVVPAQLAADVAKKAMTKSEWEVFSRMKLAEGGSLTKYYPLNDEAKIEYENWRKLNGK